MTAKDRRFWARRHADGVRLRTVGDNAGAETALKEAIRLAEHMIPPDEHLPASLYQLGMLNYERGDYLEAERLFRRAIAAEEAALGADHPYVAMILRSLARLLRRTGRVDEAHELEERAQAIWQAASDEGARFSRPPPPLAMRESRLSQRQKERA